MQFSLRLVFLILLALFLVSAWMGALISYNTSLAWSRFAAIVVGVAVCVLFVNLPIEKAQTVAIFLPAIVLLYFLLTNDWTSRLGKVAWLDPLLRWFATWQPQFPGVRLDSNSLGGVLAMLLPLQVAALWGKGQLKTLGGIALIGISIIGVLISESRGAWVALIAVVGIGVLGQASQRIAPRSVRVAVFAVLVAMGMLGLMIFGQTLLQLRSDRWDVWRNSLDLASDYPFTGVGLGGFEMAYSSYVVLLHVGHTIHAHDLFLDVWLEQGLLGLVTLGALIVVAIQAMWNRQTTLIWHTAAFASLGVIILHGLTDDPFYGYGGTAIPFLFLPLGVLASMLASEQTRLNFRFALATLSAIVVAIIIIGLVPSVRASFVANLGALAQTQAELAVYHWPEVPIQDELRRTNQIDLSPAITQYQLALVIDPNNATANRRVGQIEISRGEYVSARQHLQVAFASAPAQRATRQMLGELYAIEGNVDQAIRLWQSIDVSDGQLEIRRWWYGHIGAREQGSQLQKAMLDGNW